VGEGFGQGAAVGGGLDLVPLLVEGEVAMDVNYALEPEEIEKGYVLTCQAHPASEKVVLDYDA